MRRHRPKIQWTGGHKETKKTAQGPNPHPYMGQTTWGSKEDEGNYALYLVPGSLWRAAAPLRPEILTDHWQNHEFLYLHEDGPWGSCPFPVGTLAIYMGEHRVTERMRDGKTIRVHRHSFLLGGARYIVKHMAHFEPVKS